jgi:hypothetical protein
MKKLTTEPVGAKSLCMELLARLAFVVWLYMVLSDKFMCAMSEAARVLELTRTRKLPVPTHLSLQLSFVLLDEKVSILVRGKLSFGALERRHLVVIDNLLFLIRSR